MSASPRTWFALTAACALLTGALAGGDALAITSHQARECRPNRLTNTDFAYLNGVSYTGVLQEDKVGCPLSLGTQPSGCVPVADVVVRYEDNSLSGAVKCWIEQSSFNGVLVYTGPVRWSCATAGGCDAPPPTGYTGRNYLRMVPTGSAVANCIDQRYEVMCLIPGPQEQASSVFSYYAD
jgi:hypothetical protein